MTETKGNNEETKDTGKRINAQIKFGLNDLLVLGFNMAKSGFGLIQSLEKVMDSKFSELVDKGELKPDEANKLRSDISNFLKNSVNQFTTRINDGIEGTLNRLNIATVKDINSLEKRLDTLLESIDKIIEEKKAEAKKSAGKSRSTASRKSTGTASSRKRAPGKTTKSRSSKAEK